MKEAVSTLTQYACVVALAMSAFSFHVAIFDYTQSQTEQSRNWALQEMVTTAILTVSASSLLRVVTWGISSWLCLYLSLFAAASASFTLANMMSYTLLLVSFLGWVCVVADEDEKRKTGPDLEYLKPQPFVLMPNMTNDHFWARLGNYLKTFMGFYGLTLALSIAVFILRVYELDQLPWEIRIAKGSARAFELCLLFCALPVAERILPFMVQLFCCMPKAWRIKDKHVHRRIVELGNVYAVIHVLAHFFAYANVCGYQMTCLSPFAWVSGFGLVWVFVLVYVFSISSELRRHFDNIHRIGHLSLMALFLLHMPEIGYWLVFISLLIVAESIVRWCCIRTGKIVQAEVLSGVNGYTHLSIQITDPNLNDGVKMEGMLNVKIPDVGKEWKPFTMFRLRNYDGHGSIFHCIIKTHPGGWTDKLQRAIGDGTLQIGARALLDGPHATLSMKHPYFTNFLLLASGVGVTVVFSALGGIDASTCGYLRCEWSLRVGELRNFENALAMFATWKQTSFPQLHLRINVSGCDKPRVGAKNKEDDAPKDPNLIWLQSLSSNGQAFEINLGRAEFGPVFTAVKDAVKQGRVAVFGCGTREYCASVKRAANEHFFANQVSFHCNLEVV